MWIVRIVAKIISDRQLGPVDSSSMCAYLQGRCATVSSWSRAGLRWAGSMARTDTRLPGSCGTRARYPVQPPGEAPTSTASSWGV